MKRHLFLIILRFQGTDRTLATSHTVRIMFTAYCMLYEHLEFCEMSSLECNLFIKETTRSAITSMAAEQCRWGLILKWDRLHIDCHPMNYHLVDLDNAMASSSKPKWTLKMCLLQFSREICKTTSAFQRRGWKCNNHHKNPSVRHIPQSYLALLSSPSFRGSALRCGTNIVA